MQTFKFGKIALLLLFILGLLLTPYRIFSLNGISRAATDTAKHYNGIREVRPNSSPVIDVIIRYTGGHPGESWCMRFVNFCFKRAAEALKMSSPLSNTGRCSAQLKYAKGIGSGLRVIEVAGTAGKVKIQKGDILIFKHGYYKKRDIGRDWDGHTAISLYQIDANDVRTIEGNTNIAGSREGDGVYIKNRYLYIKNFPVIAIIRAI